MDLGPPAASPAWSERSLLYPNSLSQTPPSFTDAHRVASLFPTPSLSSQDSNLGFPQDFPGPPAPPLTDTGRTGSRPPDSLLVGAVPVHRMPVSQRPSGPLGQQRQQRHGHEQQQQQQRSRRHPRSRRRRRPPTEPRTPGFSASQLPAAAAASPQS